MGRDLNRNMTRFTYGGGEGGSQTYGWMFWSSKPSLVKRYPYGALGAGGVKKFVHSEAKATKVMLLCEGDRGCLRKSAAVNFHLSKARTSICFVSPVFPPALSLSAT